MMITANCHFVLDYPHCPKYPRVKVLTDGSLLASGGYSCPTVCSNIIEDGGAVFAFEIKIRPSICPDACRRVRDWVRGVALQPRNV